MERKYDEAIDAFEDTIKAIADTYYLEDCEVEIKAAVDTLVETGKDLDTEIDNLRDENEELKKQLSEKEDELQSHLDDYANSCVIRVPTLQMREKLEHFITTELYPYHNDKQEWALK